MSQMNLNLIPSKAKFQAARIKLQKQVRLTLTIVLALWTAVGVTLFSWEGVVRLRFNKVTAAKALAEENYRSMKDDIVTSQQLKYRAKMVGGVLNDRFEYGKSFEIINSLFPAEITITSIDLNEGGVFLIRGGMTSKVAVDTLEKLITDINAGAKENLRAAKLTALAVNSGVWNFAVEVALK